MNGWRWLVLAFTLMVATPPILSGLTLDSLLAERARRAYLVDPAGWVDRRCHEFVWSKQRTIMESVRDHRETAVQSCHEIGKSFIAARIAAWWLDTHVAGEAFVVTSAPSFAQVRAVLWREIGRAHASGNLLGRVNQTEWFLPMRDGRQEMVAFGRKPANLDPTGFQGIHAKYVLVIFDEACGIPAPLWHAADSLVANEFSRFLAIGNPDSPATEFGEICKPGSGWNVIQIGAFDTPNFTGEAVPENLRHLLVSRVWQEAKLRRWGEDNPLYQSKVLGKFPKRTDGGLFPIDWILAAQARWDATLKPMAPDRATFADGETGDAAYGKALQVYQALPNELGVDVGGGGDESCICHRHGPWAKIIHTDTNPDTMVTTGNVLRLLIETGASRAKVDNIGIGRGVVDRAKEQGRPVVGVNVSLPPDVLDVEAREGYLNLRAEFYWALRDRFRTGDIAIDPTDEDLAAELTAIRYKPTSRGQIQIESKDDMRKRGIASPNRADALMLAFATAHSPGDGWLAFMRDQAEAHARKVAVQA